MATPKLPKNDGWKDLAYDFGLDAGENERLSRLLNDVCHGFHYHPVSWREGDEDVYVRQLATELNRRPTLAERLLNTDDPVVKMITRRALDLVKVRSDAPE